MRNERVKVGFPCPKKVVQITLGGLSILAGISFSSAAHAAISTGAFSSPLTSNLLLSLDINGGIIASNNTTTEGSNGPSATPVLSADPYGVTWTAWGGPVGTNGDGTQLPNSGASGGGPIATSISKTANGITVSIIESGTGSNYAKTGGVQSLNGRDRGNPSGAASDNDVFRDFIMAGGSGSNIQSTNFLQVLVSGLTPNTAYQLAGFSYDSTSTANKEEWTAMPPSSDLTNGTHIGYNPDPAAKFIAPADEQTQSFSSLPAPAVFNVTTDASGSVSLYTWGGDGITNNQSGSTSYINGLQIASAGSVPEPASLGLLSAAGLSLLSRRRSRQI